MLLSMWRSLVSSNSLSCKHWLLARFARCCKGTEDQTEGLLGDTRDQAKNVNPVENSFSISIITLSSMDS